MYGVFSYTLLKYFVENTPEKVFICISFYTIKFIIFD